MCDTDGSPGACRRHDGLMARDRVKHRFNAKPKRPRRGKSDGILLVNVYDHVVTVADDNPVLTTPAVVVERFDSKLRDVCNRMLWLTRHDPNCLGLAAPQRGVGKRIFTLKIHRDGGQDVVCIVNPSMEPALPAKTNDYEGCFSMPDKRVRCERYLSIVVRGFDMYGNEVEYKLGGRAAVAAQHELDHLDGVLIRDHGPVEDVRGEVLATGENLPGEEMLVWKGRSVGMASPYRSPQE